MADFGWSDSPSFSDAGQEWGRNPGTLTGGPSVEKQATGGDFQMWLPGDRADPRQPNFAGPGGSAAPTSPGGGGAPAAPGYANKYRMTGRNNGRLYLMNADKKGWTEFKDLASFKAALPEELKASQPDLFWDEEYDRALGQRQAEIGNEVYNLQRTSMKSNTNTRYQPAAGWVW
jgi:hypothetical protein